MCPWQSSRHRKKPSPRTGQTNIYKLIHHRNGKSTVKASLRVVINTVGWNIEHLADKQSKHPKRHYEQISILQTVGRHGPWPSCLRNDSAKYYGKRYLHSSYAKAIIHTVTGVNLVISEAAARHRPCAHRYTHFNGKTEQQQSNCRIIHWNQKHFVVLYKIEKEKGQTWFYIADLPTDCWNMRNRSWKKCWISTTQGGIEKIALLLDVNCLQFCWREPIKYEKLSLWYLFSPM